MPSQPTLAAPLVLSRLGAFDLFRQCLT
jgi:hypothetical protein